MRTNSRGALNAYKDQRVNMKAKQVLRRGAIAAIVAVVATLGILPYQHAQAHQVPSGCNSNALRLVISKDKTMVRLGDVITYEVHITNVDVGSEIACDVTNATVNVTLPAMDGTATGQTVTLVTGASYSAGFPDTVIGIVQYTVNANPGITDLVAAATLSGTLHDAPVDHSADILKTIGTSVTRPSMLLSKSASPSSGRVPFKTTFNFTVTNTSPENVPISNVNITDNDCPSSAFKGGDSNGNNLLDVNESWFFACTKTFTTPGIFTNTASVQGISTVDGRQVGSNNAQATVRVRSITGVLPGLPATGTTTTSLNDKHYLWVAELTNEKAKN